MCLYIVTGYLGPAAYIHILHLSFSGTFMNFYFIGKVKNALIYTNVI